MIRRGLAAIGSLLVAAALATGSGASFQSSSANTGNLIRAGVVTVTTTKTGVALLNVTGLVPGASVTGNVDVTNAGDVSARFTLAASNLVDVPASPALSGKVDLKVEDLTASTTVYNGKLGALSSVGLGTLGAGVTHTFRFTVSLTNGAIGAENAYQDGRTTVDYTWSADTT